jgi:methylmalonyl-CoA/ethylmalonyl-CoA epimerase
MASFFAVGGSKIELLAATRPDSPIAIFIEKRGEGLHHVAYAVADLQAELDRLDAAGVALIHRHPKPGADNKIIAFLHPKATGGSLIELCQDVRTAY